MFNKRVYVCVLLMLKRVCEMSAETLINVLVFCDPIRCSLIDVIVTVIMIVFDIFMIIIKDIFDTPRAVFMKCRLIP